MLSQNAVSAPLAFVSFFFFFSLLSLTNKTSKDEPDANGWEAALSQCFSQSM